MLGDRKTESVGEYVRQLRAAIAERAAAEASLESNFGGAQQALDEKARLLVEEVERKYASCQADAQERFEAARDEAAGRYETEYNAVAAAMQSALQTLDRQYEQDTAAIESERDDARWMVTSVLDDDAEDSPKRKLKNFKAQISAAKEQMETDTAEAQAAHDDVAELLRKRRQWWDVAAQPVEPTGERSAAHERFQAAATGARETIAAIRRRFLSRLLAGWNFLILVSAIWGISFAAVYFTVDPAATRINIPQDPAAWIMLVAGLALAPAVLLGSTLYTVNRSRGSRLLRQLRQQMAELNAMHQQWVAFSKKELDEQHRGFQRWQKEFVQDRENRLARIESTHAQKLHECQEHYHQRRNDTEADFTGKLDDIVKRRDMELRALDASFAQTSTRLAGECTTETDAIQHEYDHLKTQRSAEEEFDRGALSQAWLNGISDFTTDINRCGTKCLATSPDWDDIAREDWTLPGDVPELIRFGHFDCDLAEIPEGLPRDERLQPDETRFEVPAILTFPESGSLLYKTKGDGRAAAVESMRNVMLRFLTSLPPGKVRFTVIDPAGLGEAFSAFMHLADYDELMIGSRIWTEPAQIEKRLSELSEHMENIFQAYLRNEFETIDEYNKQAGEVAEPYHVLVVTNFPSNFTEPAARRLANIATSGARCGVYTLVSVDTTQPLPHKFDLADLEQHATTLRWKKNRFVAADPDLAELPLTLDAPPYPKDFNSIVHSAGRQSKNARKVEVSFERIAPKGGELWTQDSRSELVVPLGRAGATKLQSLSLGKGTSQHVLVAGKTGSGKSSFLHALITNMSLYYGPDQVEFFLIDFKKGVEFKTYATHALPHARVIGIESDREFGVSVLERLDGILKERGELFRERGVQDLKSFRDQHPGETLPRILLVIDEFQEFFVDDDALSQSASLLLDRLVRQGRAFGIHVLLGSQTLGGAYSLARSTLGQVAVRIALQCSESDAHLILSEENTAARLLTRPGEAIYNDANGLLEGNHPFQVAWLPDDQRETCLQQLQQRATDDGVDVEPPIVFEGHVASDSRRNRELNRLIESYAAAAAAEDGPREVTTGPTTPRVWLGEAVSIKPPAKILFHRRPGDNLLIVGQDAGAAYGLLSTSLITLAAQQPASEKPDDSGKPAPFTVLCGEAVSADSADGATGRLASWQELAQAIPQECRIAGQREAAACITEIAAEVERRAATDNGESAPPLFVLISDLSRFRDLRGERDDFGFSMGESDKPKSAGALLSEVLSDGPAVGVHCLIWCDTYANLNRWMTMSLQREFEVKIAFRMNGADSSNLIDTPAASRLGTHRAFVYRGDTGTVEKFRPYAAPSDEWLQHIADRLHGRESNASPAPNALGTWDDVEMLSVS